MVHPTLRLRGVDGEQGDGGEAGGDGDVVLEKNAEGELGGEEK